MSKASTQIDAAFSRELLKRTHIEVRKHFPTVKVSEAWVYKLGRDQWEFHGPNDYYWHGRATCAAEARHKGWWAYLAKMGKVQ